MTDSPKKRRRVPLFWRILRGALLTYVCVLAFVYFFQRSLLFLPDQTNPSRPSSTLYEDIRDVRLEVGEERLECWYWPGMNGRTIVLFHGNAGNRLHRLDWLDAFHREGYGVFFLDYRGYGGSTGSPSEEGLYEDALAAVDWLEREGAGELVYFGESIGAGVAVEAARRKPPAALVLYSAYSSLVDVAQGFYWYLPVAALMRDPFHAIDRIGEVRCPLLAIHGTSDEIIPLEIGRKLFDAANDPKRWLAVEGATHNGLVMRTDVLRVTREFLAELTSAK